MIDIVFNFPQSGGFCKTTKALAIALRRQQRNILADLAHAELGDEHVGLH